MGLDDELEILEREGENVQYGEGDENIQGVLVVEPDESASEGERKYFGKLIVRGLEKSFGLGCYSCEFPEFYRINEQGLITRK